MIKKFNEYINESELFYKTTDDENTWKEIRKKFVKPIPLSNLIIANLSKIFNEPYYHLMLSTSYSHPFTYGNRWRGGHHKDPNDDKCPVINIYHGTRLKGSLYCLPDEYFLFSNNRETGKYYMVDGYDGLKEMKKSLLNLHD